MANLFMVVVRRTRRNDNGAIRRNNSIHPRTPEIRRSQIFNPLDSTIFVIFDGLDLGTAKAMKITAKSTTIIRRAICCGHSSLKISCGQREAQDHSGATLSGEGVESRYTRWPHRSRAHIGDLLKGCSHECKERLGILRTTLHLPQDIRSNIG